MSKWDAKAYRENSKNQTKWALQSIKDASIKKGEDVLDIGCGDGRATYEIAKNVKPGKVMGIDSSAKMIKLANDSFKRRNLSYKVCDARKINYKEKFDVIFSTSCLHWVKDHKPVLKGIYKALKNEGRIYLMMGGQGNVAEVYKVMNILKRRTKWKKYFSDFEYPYFFPSVKEYKPLVKKAGLKEVSIKLIDKKAVFKGKNELKGWIETTWMPYTDKVPAGTRDEFINDATELCIKNNGIKKNGTITFGMKRLIVKAVKAIEK